MRFGTLALLLTFTVAAGLACSGDDDDSSAPTAAGSPTITGTIPADAPLTASPSRELPPADHVGLIVVDALTFMQKHVQSGPPIVHFCARIDLQTGIIDCKDAGYGTIAVDPLPQVASGELSCRVLLTAQGDLFAASCAGQLPNGPGAYIYGIES